MGSERDVTAVCHECGRKVPLRSGGALRLHRPQEHAADLCPGSGEAPRELEELAGYLVHPAASAWPLMSEAELDELADDIQRNGLRSPVRMRGALVLDGRNRLLACARAGVPPVVVHDHVEDPYAWVVSANLHRRHLTTSQRAMVAARLATLPHGHRQTGQMAGVPTQAEAAELLGVGERTVRRAREVIEAGDPELEDAVVRGDLSVSAAAAQLRPDAAQDAPPSVPGVPPVRAELAGLQVGDAVLLEDDQERWYGTVEGVGTHLITVAWEEVDEHVSVDALCSLETGEEHGTPDGRLPVRVLGPHPASGRRCEEPTDGGSGIERPAGGGQDVPLAELPVEEQRALAEQLDPAVVRRLERERREERKAEQRRRREERLQEQAQAAATAAPEIEGVDLRLGRAGDVLRDLRGAGARLVHADPPWRYEHQGHGAAAAHYSTMPMPEIVSDLELAYDACAPDALLVLWCTWAMLPEWLSQTDGWRWGPVVTAGAWHKIGGLGTGRLWRGCTEPVLVYERGRVLPEVAISAGHSSTRLRHSEKPELWLRSWLSAWVPEGGLVLDPYAGLAPMARACARMRRRYVGVEIDPDRHRLAVAELASSIPDPRQLDLSEAAP